MEQQLKEPADYVVGYSCYYVVVECDDNHQCYCDYIRPSWLVWQKQDIQLLMKMAAVAERQGMRVVELHRYCWTCDLYVLILD